MTTNEAADRRLPIVDYLDINDPQHPYLRGQCCRTCGARYVGRRNGCGRCGGVTFDQVRLPDHGVVHSATTIHRSAPGLTVPYTSIVVDLDGGGAVKATYLGPAEVTVEKLLGSRVRLATGPVATDGTGTVAIGFGYVSDDGSTRDDAMGETTREGEM